MLTAERPIQELVNDHGASLQTPYYLIDEMALLKNLEKIKSVRERSGAKSVLALKCFSTWSVFDLMRQYMDGTTSSSLYEARLGHEKFGKEVHAYSVAFSDADVEQVSSFATKIIFNSVSQLERFALKTQAIPRGLRINPGMSYSHFDLADPARKYSRLGATDPEEIRRVLPLISGAMFHCQCENNDFDAFSRILDHIGRQFSPILHELKWVSLGGGIYFTQDGYPLDAFAEKLADFAKRYNVQVYLEPGETAITCAGYLVTQVLDIVHHEVDVAIVDAGVETHMLDLLIYRTDAKMIGLEREGHTYMIAGRTCLAGDIFGTFTFSEKLRVGSPVIFSDAAGYTMVKKNWFNGVPMPSIVVRRLDGRVEVVRHFEYDDYLDSLS
jgi:carboxynorspermidine decarboxylase